MIGVVLALLIVPLAAGITCAALPLRAVRAAAAVTVASGIACFGLVLALVPAAAHHDLNYLSYLRALYLPLHLLYPSVRSSPSAQTCTPFSPGSTCSPGDADRPAD